MLSIGCLSSGDYVYYINDYYVERTDSPGQWLTSSKALGVKGEVKEAELLNLFKGYSANSVKPLVQNAGEETRRAAFDLTFCAPKSVSIFWALQGKEERAVIERCHKEAVLEVFEKFLGPTCGKSRTGKGGEVVVSTPLVAALFDHYASRAGDPLLHTHAVVINATRRNDGSTGTLEARGLFVNKMAAGSLYRVALATKLQERLSLPLYQKNSWFEVRGISKAVIRAFSKRREEILEYGEQEKVISGKGHGDRHHAHPTP